MTFAYNLCPIGALKINGESPWNKITVSVYSIYNSLQWQNAISLKANIFLVTYIRVREKERNVGSFIDDFYLFAKPGIESFHFPSLNLINVVSFLRSSLVRKQDNPKLGSPTSVCYASSHITWHGSCQISSFLSDVAREHGERGGSWKSQQTYSRYQHQIYHHPIIQVHPHLSCFTTKE